MKYRRRPRLRIFGGLAALLAASILAGAPAHADVLPNNPIIPDYSSDPDARWCYRSTPSISEWGICLYTSRDDRPSGWNYGGGNPYPMTVTRMYYLPPGKNPGVQSNWVAGGSTVNVDGVNAGGVIFQENQMTWVPGGTRHLWAPGGYHNGPQGRHYLLVPDLENASQPHSSSRIGVARTSGNDPLAGYSYVNRLDLNKNSAPNGGYASDPMLMDSLSSFWPFLVYANGDWDTRPCGKISFAMLNFEMNNVQPGWPRHLVVNSSNPPANSVNMTGVPDDLKDCNGQTDYYFEGPQIFSRYVNGAPKYYLMFAAKPRNRNSVIAYAMADQAEGPYAYQGIIMESSSTEWTNQASIVQDAGSKEMSYFFYHDGGSGTPHTRKVHAECFRFRSNGTIPTITRTTSTSSSSWIGNCWDD